MVIFPGFGNDKADYLMPLGLPVETGLKAALTRRGAGDVSVVPIHRPDWLNVAKGLSDAAFVAGNAQPEGPAFSWYLRLARRTVEEAVTARRDAEAASDPRVVLIGHSAGGWLARALGVVVGKDWFLEHVRGVVTLGAPHSSPPADVADQTRGTIPNVNLRAPGAFYKESGVFYVTASSRRVVGNEDGDASQRNALTAYRLVLGQGQGVAGDGFVPIDAAFLDGAAQLTLDCYHSGGGADPWPKDDWYGSERWVDAWLGPVNEQLTAQVGTSLLSTQGATNAVSRLRGGSVTGGGTPLATRRRFLLCGGGSLLIPSRAALAQPSSPPRPVPPPPSVPLAVSDNEASSAASDAAITMAGRLLSTIPAMAYGAPATNATLDPRLVAEIESQAVALERLGQRGNARAASLNGTWRLLYSNAREISNLASGLPLGFVLGPTYQPVDLARGAFENQGNVLHALGIARAATTVVGDVRATVGSTTNAAGTVSSDENRIDVDFRRITFELTEIFGHRIAPPLRKAVVPKQLSDAAQPANDVLYLDGTMRVTRGGDDGIFIFRREVDDGYARPLLTAAQREELYSEGGGEVFTGKGIAGDDPNAPPELRKLLKGRSAEQPF